MISTERLADAFVALADSLVDDYDLVDFLTELADHAAEVSGAGAVGVVLADHHGRVRYLASNNESGKLMELMQLQSDEGPCLDCVRSGEPVVNADLASSVAWPVFAPRAVAAGFQSVHAFPMRLRDEVVGALNLFGDRSVFFADNEVRVVQALADVATIAVLQERAIANAEELAVQLNGALNTRVVIEQAKGALAQSDGITPEQAFDLLRSTARSTRTKLVDVARGVLDNLQRRPSP